MDLKAVVIPGEAPESDDDSVNVTTVHNLTLTLTYIHSNFIYYFLSTVISNKIEEFLLSFFIPVAIHLLIQFFRV